MTKAVGQRRCSRHHRRLESYACPAKSIVIAERSLQKRAKRREAKLRSFEKLTTVS